MISSRPCAGARTTSRRLVAIRSSGTVKFTTRQARPTLRTIMVPVAPPMPVPPRPIDTAHRPACISWAETADENAPAASSAAAASVLAHTRRGRDHVLVAVPLRDQLGMLEDVERDLEGGPGDLGVRGPAAELLVVADRRGEHRRVDLGEEGSLRLRDLGRGRGQ